MPQKKIQVRGHSYYELFQVEMFKFARKWRETFPIHRDNLNILANIAGNGVFLDGSFTRLYRDRPDFSLELLVHLRHQWNKLDKSKSGRLQRFMATAVVMKPKDAGGMKWKDPFGRVPQIFLSDGQIASAFEHWSKKTYGTAQSVKIDDVVKARKKVVSRIRAGERMASKCFDKDGMMLSGRRAARRKGG